MAGSQINVGLVGRITPDVVTHRRVHILAGGVQIFLVAFDLVDECTLGNRDRNIVLLPARLSRWRRRISSQRAHVTERLPPKFTVRGARALTQVSEFFIGNVNAWM